MPDPAAISVQLYTVRRLLAEDFDGTIAALAGMGFEGVEIFDLLGYRDRLKESLPRHGLASPTAHIDILAADAREVATAAADLGVTTVIQPWTDPKRWEDDTGITELADALNAAATRAAQDGLRVGYHNHQFELASMVDGRHALEVFADRLAPEVVLEVDAYWAFAGGADVPALVRRLGDRVVALHLKDGDGSLDTTRQVAAGAGVVPLADVAAAAANALRIVELDDTAGDMLDAVRSSHDYLASLANG